MSYATEERERLFSGHSGRLFVLLTLAFVAVKLTQRLLPPLLPVIIDDLAITPFLAGIALSAMSVFRAGIQFPSGRFADQLSRTTVLLAALIVVVASLAVLALTPTYLAFLLGVSLFGISSGLYDPADRALLSDLFREKRGRAFGLHMMGSDFSGILAAGLAIGIVAVTTWRAAFLLPLLVLVPIPLVLYRLSREPVTVSPIDLGIVPTLRRLFGASRMRWLVAAYTLFVFSSMGVTGFLPTFLTEVHGVSFAVASSSFALLYAVGVVSKPVSGAVSDRFPRPVVAGVGLVLGGAGLAVLVAAPAAAMAIVGIGVYAVGQRAVPPPLQAHLMDQFPDDSMGGDLGAVRTIYMGIGSLGPAYTGFIASRLGYAAAYASIVVLFVAGGVVLLRLALAE